MQLIGTLASGVAGAEGGYARIFVRGSSRRARYFVDFEGKHAIEGDDVLLDEHGGAVIYTNITVDVLVYGADALLVRRWIESSTAACVEVVSQSFTGADYETGVGGPGLPTTAAAVFDRVLDSFGATDWLVKMPDGSEIPLQDAIAAVQTVFFNVRSPLYGAVGDGVANDHAAITAAIAAAVAHGGGTVFFPAGRYYIASQTLTVPRTVSLVGAGSAASSIESDRSASGPGNAVIQLGSAATALGPGPQLVQSLRFVHTSASGTVFINVVSGNIASISRCAFLSRAEESISIASGKTYVVIDDCDFSVAGVGPAILSWMEPPLASRGRVDIRRSRFVVQSSTTVVAVIRGLGIHLLGCFYDGTLSAKSGIIVFDPTATSDLTVYGSARCCEFLDSAARNITCFSFGNLTASNEWFTEDGNFLSALNASSVMYSGTYGTVPVYYCRLGSRESRMKSVVTAVVGPTITQTGEFGIINVRSTFAGNFSLVIDSTAPLGARLRMTVVNGDAGARTVSFGSNVRGGSYVIGSNEAIGFEFVRAVVNNGVGDIAAWYLIGTSGVLTTGTDSSYVV